MVGVRWWVLVLVALLSMVLVSHSADAAFLCHPTPDGENCDGMEGGECPPGTTCDPNPPANCPLSWSGGQPYCCAQGNTWWCSLKFTGSVGMTFFSSCEPSNLWTVRAGVWPRMDVQCGNQGVATMFPAFEAEIKQGGASVRKFYNSQCTPANQGRCSPIGAPGNEFDQHAEANGVTPGTYDLAGRYVTKMMFDHTAGADHTVTYPDTVTWSPLGTATSGGDPRLTTIEVCDDNVDNDCDGQIDCFDAECTSTPFCQSMCDQDSDGFAPIACPGFPAPRDCNDNDPSIYPGNTENTNGLCSDGKDNNCNNKADCADSSCSALPSGICCGPSENYCADGIDNDCDAGNLMTGGGIDCEDEECDSSSLCDGCDADADGFARLACSGGTDCNDNNPNIHPGAPEICSNGIDDDCDGQINEGCTEICTLGTGDENGNGKTNYDSSDGKQADPACKLDPELIPVPSGTTFAPDSAIDIECQVGFVPGGTGQLVNCVTSCISADGDCNDASDTICSPNGISGRNLKFSNCNVGTVGSKKIVCEVEDNCNVVNYRSISKDITVQAVLGKVRQGQMEKTIWTAGEELTTYNGNAVQACTSGNDNKCNPGSGGTNCVDKTTAQDPGNVICLSPGDHDANGAPDFLFTKLDGSAQSLTIPGYFACNADHVGSEYEDFTNPSLVYTCRQKANPNCGYEFVLGEIPAACIASAAHNNDCTAIGCPGSCTDQCTPGSDYPVCVASNAKVQTCEMGSMGCYELRNTTCGAGSQCAGAAGSASCQVQTCASLSTQGTCTANSACEWCLGCNGPRSSGGPNRCVPAGDCVYACSTSCGAACNAGSTVACTGPTGSGAQACTGSCTLGSCVTSCTPPESDLTYTSWGTWNWGGLPDPDPLGPWGVCCDEDHCSYNGECWEKGRRNANLGAMCAREPGKRAAGYDCSSANYGRIFPHDSGAQQYCCYDDGAGDPNLGQFTTDLSQCGWCNSDSDCPNPAGLCNIGRCVNNACTTQYTSCGTTAWICSSPTTRTRSIGQCTDTPVCSYTPQSTTCPQACSGGNCITCDADGDGYSYAGAPAVCQTAGYLPGDCNDVAANGGATVYPGAEATGNYCRDNKDNDCSGNVYPPGPSAFGQENYDGHFTSPSTWSSHGDPACRVGITAINAPALVNTIETCNNDVLITCTANPGDVRSVSASLGGVNCPAVGVWYPNGVLNKIDFACNATLVPDGARTARCYVDETKSYATSGQQDKNATVQIACRSSVSGTVTSTDPGVGGLDKVAVTISNIGTKMTLPNGGYSFTPAPGPIFYGYYDIVADAPEELAHFDGKKLAYSFDSQNEVIDFALQPWQCTGNCTFGEGDRCDYSCVDAGACDLNLGITPEIQTLAGTTDDAEITQRFMDVCQGALKGTRRDYNDDLSAGCCIGPIKSRSEFEGAFTLETCSPQVVPHTTLVNYNGKIHKLTVLTYSTC